MSMRTWFQSPRVRRSLAVSAIVLSAGGLVLMRAPASAESVSSTVQSAGANGASFSGPGLKGSMALSHQKVLADGERRVFAELDLRATAAQEAVERAPLSLVVVLDTSGSMSGEKIAQAKRSVTRLIQDMRDDDRVALVRYASDAELIQPMARVGDIRHSLINRVEGLSSGGGTFIPGALRRGLDAIPSFERQRVQRIVLVSDGLDSTQAEATRIASDSAERGITISALGIGLDFDESYMSSVASSGHGNFAFVERPEALAQFLRRELHEAASTTISSATAKISLPDGVRFVRAVGADARTRGDDVLLSVGSMFAGDQRRVIVELAADLDAGDSEDIDTEIEYELVGGDDEEIELASLTLTGTSDELAVAEGRDGRVVASATSVMASRRQMEAAQAYKRGDVARARQLIDANLDDLQAAAADAPEEEAEAMERQAKEYKGTRSAFGAAAPSSPEGNAAAKKAFEKDSSNMARKAF